MLTLRFLAVRDVPSASIRDEGNTYWSIQIQGGRRTCFVDMRENLQEQSQKQQQHAKVRELC